MAAPTPTDSATMGTVLDFPRERRARRVPLASLAPDELLRRAGKWLRDPSPEEVLAEHALATRVADAALDRDFGPAVYRTLLADLEGWPRAFQRRIADPMREARDGGESWHLRPDWIWRRFTQGRAIGIDHPRDGEQQGCGCGCSGFNDSFLRHLRMLRTESAETREIRAKAVHSPRSRAALRRRRARIANWKGELLELLWLHGQRKIDRARLREHAAEHVRAELADVQRWIREAPVAIREYRARLRENLTYDRRGPTDRPLTPQRRLEFERSIAETKRRVPEWRARAARLEQLLADPHALAREWTGCERVAVGAP